MKDIKNLLSQLTLQEKASLLSGLNMWYLKGLDRLGIPSIMVTDGSHGLRKQTGDATLVDLISSVPATCFPTSSALAATWNRDLVYQVGAALGEECRQEKVGVVLGPGTNIKRSPLCGRNFEYFSEDPYLSGEMAKSHIRGVQSQGVGTSLKHFAFNNQEYRRMTSDSILDERAKREIYLAGFEIAVREGQPWTVMCSYNRIDGVYACENKSLLNDILRQEWGFTGVVVTDWGAMTERVPALQAGVDLEMPGTLHNSDDRLLAALRRGDLDEATLDRAVERILDLIFKAQATLSQDYSYDPQAHHALARQVAGEAAVLLKNQGGLLPLRPDTKIALIGRFAREPRYQGAGSSLMNPTRLDNLYDELALIVGVQNILYAPGYTPKGDVPDEGLIAEAMLAAGQADVVVVCAGLTDVYEVEGLDRTHLNLPPGHDALIQRLAVTTPRLIVVLSNGSPVAMPWASAVPAILEGYLGGQAGAGALADILTGKVNPSGKLAETFPLRLPDTPAQPYPGGPAIVPYCESIYVGYRFYDTANLEVLFPFGHGLSYTRFDYRDLVLSENGEQVRVTLKVRNSGAAAGKEVVQLYVHDLQASVFRPDQELKGFTKVDLQPGKETEVSFPLDRRAFAFYDTTSRDWVVEPGDFEIRVGASSRDIRLRAVYHRSTGYGRVSSADREKLSAYEHPTREHGFPQADFEALLGRPLPQPKPQRKGSYTIHTPIPEMQDSLVGRFLYKMTRNGLGNMIRDKADTPTGLLMSAMSQDMPLRSMLMGGPFDRDTLDALLLMINGHTLSGVFALIRSGWRRLFRRQATAKQ